MKVKVREEGIKLNGVWKFKGEETVIDEEQYERNKNFLNIIEDEEGPKLPQIPSKEDEEPKQSDVQNTEDNEDAEDERSEEEMLMELRMKAKELGIKNYHLMGKEKLETAIAEKEAPLFGTTPDEENDGTDTDVGSNAETTETNPEKTQEAPNPENVE